MVLAHGGLAGRDRGEGTGLRLTALRGVWQADLTEDHVERAGFPVPHGREQLSHPGPGDSLAV